MTKHFNLKAGAPLRERSAFDPIQQKFRKKPTIINKIDDALYIYDLLLPSQLRELENDLTELLNIVKKDVKNLEPKIARRVKNG
jgi:hypothetical protein